MAKHGTSNGVFLDAPSGYFIVRTQHHRSFYGTEFGYACWYIKASLDYALRELGRRRSPELIADRLKSPLAGFQLNDLRIFPLLLPCESLSAGSCQSPSLIPIEKSSQARLGSSCPAPVRSIITPSSSLACKITGNSNGSSTSTFANSASLPPSLRPDKAVPAGGRDSDSHVNAGKTVRGGLNPHVRVVSPHGTKRSPRPAKTHRRATPYPERDNHFQQGSTQHVHIG